MPFTLTSNAHCQESVDELMNNYLAGHAASIVFFIRHLELVDSWDKCLNEYGRYVEKYCYCLTFEKVCLLNFIHFLITRNGL